MKVGGGDDDLRIDDAGEIFNVEDCGGEDSYLSKEDGVWEKYPKLSGLAIFLVMAGIVAGYGHACSTIIPNSRVKAKLKALGYSAQNLSETELNNLQSKVGMGKEDVRRIVEELKRGAEGGESD
ncbi:hypothetical protein HOF67_03985 [Candidatus Peregrinibacteria bacterium]|jgi:hypothetical protein|nr:hypothetical protein [Candidatus Peregrinibacteria bacterium]